MPALSDLIRAAQDWLQIDAITDYPGALNGLQLANSGQVTKIAAALSSAALRSLLKAFFRAKAHRRMAAV
jgi:hypothetical protein